MWPEKISKFIGVSVVATVALVHAPSPAVAARWIQVENQHFSALSNASKKKTMAVMQELEKFRVTVQAVTVGRIPEDAPRIPVVLIGSRTEFFRRYSPARGVVGYAVPIKGRSLLVMPAFDAGSMTMMTVRHEYVHALLRFQNMEYPKWLEEGIAELLATTIIHDDKFEYGVSSSRRDFAFNDNISLDLIISNQNDPHARDEYAVYWLLAHFILIGNDRFYVPKLESYLAKLKAGEESSAAFASAFGMSANELWDAKIREYRREMPYFTLRYDAGLMDTDFTVTDAPEDAVASTLSFLSAHVGRPKGQKVSRNAKRDIEGVWQPHRYEQDCADSLVDIRFSDNGDRLTLTQTGSGATGGEFTTVRAFDVKRMVRRIISVTERSPLDGNQAAETQSWNLRFLTDDRFCLRQPDWPDVWCRPSYVRCSD